MARPGALVPAARHLIGLRLSSGDTGGHVLADPGRVGQGGQAWVHRADQVDYDRAARTKRAGQFARTRVRRGSMPDRTASLFA